MIRRCTVGPSIRSATALESEVSPPPPFDNGIYSPAFDTLVRLRQHASSLFNERVTRYRVPAISDGVIEEEGAYGKCRQGLGQYRNPFQRLDDCTDRAQVWKARSSRLPSGEAGQLWEQIDGLATMTHPAGAGRLQRRYVYR